MKILLLIIDRKILCEGKNNGVNWPKQGVNSKRRSGFASELCMFTFVIYQKPGWLQ